MPFPRAPHLELRQWDNFACEAAVAAQILYMGGRLEFPFDTSQFDRRIGRNPNASVPGVGAAELIMTELPVRAIVYTPRSAEVSLDPDILREVYRQRGYSKQRIEDFFRSEGFQAMIRRAHLQIEYAKRQGARLQEVVSPNSSRHLRGLLDQGAVVIASHSTGNFYSHLTLLVPLPSKRRRATEVLCYEPASGVSRERLVGLLHSELNLDQRGFMAYLMN